MISCMRDQRSAIESARAAVVRWEGYRAEPAEAAVTDKPVDD